MHHPALALYLESHGAALLVEAGLIAAAVSVAPAVAYCVALLVAAMGHRRALALADKPRAGEPGAGVGAEPASCFCILIPAHDESLVIASTLAAVRALDYPAGLVDCVVIADNCTDDTADLARAAGRPVRVIERRHLTERGKGYALNWALPSTRECGRIDAVVVIDADTLIDPGFLRAMDQALRSEPAAERERFAAQGLYLVQNAGEHWRAALMAGALSLVHAVRPLARERWKLSVGLKGNGMCFAPALLQALPWRGGSITEDLDYGLDLIERHGVRVRYVPGAIVRAQMPTDGKSAGGQRRRWEQGRALTVRRRALPLLASGLRRGSALRIDAALDLLCPPLAQMGALLAAWGLLAAAAVALRMASAGAWALAWGVAAALFAAYVVVGFRVGDAPATAYKALAMALFYVPWKLGVMLLARGGGGWQRTARAPLAAPDTGLNFGGGLSLAHADAAPAPPAPAPAPALTLTDADYDSPLDGASAAPAARRREA